MIFTAICIHIVCCQGFGTVSCQKAWPPVFSWKTRDFCWAGILWDPHRQDPSPHSQRAVCNGVLILAFLFTYIWFIFSSPDLFESIRQTMVIKHHQLGNQVDFSLLPEWWAQTSSIHITFHFLGGVTMSECFPSQWI